MKRRWRAAAIRRGRTRAFVAVVSAALLTCAGVASAPCALAASQSLTIRASVGFAGYYESDGWVPVTVHVENPGPTVHAEFDIAVYAVVGNGRETNTVFRWMRTLGPGSQTVQLSLPGPVLSQSPVLQCFVHGRLAAVTPLGGNVVHNVSLAAVLSSSPQDAQFLTGASDGTASGSSAGEPILPVAVGVQSLPQSANLLGGLALVAASPSSLSLLGANQAAALKTWVDLGGVLLVTGCWDPGARWRSLLPLVPGKPRSVPGDGLAMLAGTAGATPPQPVLITAAGVRDHAAVWAGDANAPLVAAVPEGRGWIVQTAFVPRDLLTWSGNAALWTGLMRKAHQGAVPALPAWFAGTGPLALTAASDALAPLRVPSLSIWLWVTVLYVAVAGPGTFWVLRRLRREPWAWMWLPALGLTVTAAIYAAGAGNRPKGVLTEGVGVVDLIRDGEAEVYGVRAFMSPWLTSATLSAQGSMLMLPLAEQGGAPEIATVTDDGRSTLLNFADVERWGVRYAYTAGVVHSQGWIDTWLTVSQGGLYGAIRNRTPYTLHHVAVCWQGQVYTVGDLAPGMTAALPGSPSFTYTGQDLWSEYASDNRDLARGIGRPLAALSATMPLPSGAGQAMVLATTDAGRLPMVPQVGAHQPVASDHTLALVREIIPVGDETQTGGAVHDPHTKPE
jgi:hypothetical protein